MAMTEETNTESTLDASKSIIDVYGAKIVLDEKQALDLNPFLDIANRKVELQEIYGQPISQLVAQLSILSQILGSVDILASALENSEHKPTEEDNRVYGNLQHAVDTTAQALLERIRLLELAAAKPVSTKPKKAKSAASRK